MSVARVSNPGVSNQGAWHSPMGRFRALSYIINLPGRVWAVSYTLHVLPLVPLPFAFAFCLRPSHPNHLYMGWRVGEMAITQILVPGPKQEICRL